MPPVEHWPFKSALVIVAHPDDETLWAGGTILMHPETRWTVVALWDAGKLRSGELRTFAYGDGGGLCAVNAERDADIFTVLPDDVWTRKRYLITCVYGFAPDSFEAKAALREVFFSSASTSGIGRRTERHRGRTGRPGRPRCISTQPVVWKRIGPPFSTRSEGECSSLCMGRS